MNGKQNCFVSLCLIVFTLTSCMSMSIEDYFYTDSNVLELCRAIRINDKTGVEQALASGVNINARGRDGMTPLGWAWYNKEKEMFRFLLQKGADPNLMITLDKRGLTGTLLQWAIELGMTDYVDMLLKYGQGINLNLSNETDSGKTPIMYAISNHRAEILERLIVCGADIEKKNERWGGGGHTPLLYAVALQRFDSALTLLNYGADWTAVTSRGKSVVDYLEKSTSHPGTPQYPWKLEFAQALIARGAKVDMEIIRDGWDITWEKQDGQWRKKKQGEEKGHPCEF